MKKFFVFCTFLLGTQVLAHSIEVNLRDVMDLASYESALKASFEIDANQQRRTFWLASWPICQNNCAPYKIKLTIETSLKENELLGETTAMVAMKKELYHEDNLVKTLQEDAFLLRPGQTHKSEDHYWGKNRLMVRQENLFKYQP